MYREMLYIAIATTCIVFQRRLQKGEGMKRGFVFLVVYAAFLGGNAAAEPVHQIDTALSWIAQKQDPDSGSWGSDPVRDTAAVLHVVQLFPGSGIDVFAAGQYLSAQQPGASDYLARKIMALADDAHAVQQDVAELLLRQNSDGGFGFFEGYPSACVDSVIALDALVLAGVDDTGVTGSALGYLTGLQQGSGAFSYNAGGPASLEMTGRALLAMHRLLPRYDLSLHIARAAGFIAAQQNADGGFGEEGSSVIETAGAIMALQAAGTCAQAVLEARTWLLSVQDPDDGSWNGRVRDTARALAALHASTGIDRANLQVHSSGISLQPSHPAAGQQVTVRCEVRNTGSRAAENVEIEFYLGDPDAGGQFLDSSSSAFLEAGAGATVQLSFTLNDDPGRADLYVIVDPRNLIPEISTDDNVAVKSFTSGTLPDLVIAGIDLSTASPLADEPFTVSASVHNLGESDAGPVVVGLYEGDPALSVPLLEVALDNVCGGCSGRADFELTLPAGTYGYVVSVAADAGVVEQNFDNNDRPCTFTVMPGMIQGLDLEAAASGISFSPAYPREDESISITAAIRNRGDVAARDAEVEIYAVDALQVSTLLHTFSWFGIGAGASAALTVDGVRLAAGMHTVFVHVIASPAQQDIVPDNNIASKTLNVLDVQDVVDIAVDDLSITPAMPHAGDPVIVRFRVTNHGNVGLAGITFGLYDGDPLGGGILLAEAVQTLPYIGAGQSLYASGVFDTTGRGGEQTLFVVVDAEYAVAEVDEENNSISGTCTVVYDPGADIVVNAGGLEFSPEQPSIADEMRIDCTVYNQGAESVAEPFEVALYAGLPQGGLQPIGVATIDSLNAHSSVRVAFTTQAAVFAASRNMFVHADYQDAIVETNEYNNTVGMDIPVSAPDLSISAADLSVAPDVLLPGQPFALHAVIHNVGEIDAHDVAAAVFNGLPGNGGEVTRVSLPLVPAGSSETAIFAISLTTGTHELHVVIDPDGEVAESSTANNTASTAVTVGFPEDYAVDLAPVAMNLDQYACDSRKLTVSGTVAVTLANAGPDAVEVPFGVCIFEDRNTNNDFDPGEDAVLGSVQVVQSVSAGSSINVDIPLFGFLTFAGNRLHVFVDSANSIPELDEDNNSTHSMAGCTQPPDDGPCVDVTASRMTVSLADMPESASITVRVGNGGAVDVAEGIDVALYDGDPAGAAVLLGTARTSAALVAGAYEDVTFAWEQPVEGEYALFAVVDDDGTGQGQLNEITRENNTAAEQVTISFSVHLKDTAVTQGAHWLVEHQHHLGGWEAFTPARANAAAIEALHISGMYLDPEFSDMYATLVQRVLAIQATNGSWENSIPATADSVLALLAAGEDRSSPAIRNAVIWLKSKQDDGGGWYNLTYYTGHAVWALVEAGVSRDDPAVLKARQWLLDTRNPDRFWGPLAGDPSHNYVFHYAIVGLHYACDASDTVGQDAITYAAAWLRANGWRANRSHTNHLTAGLNVLFYTGLYPEDVAPAVSDLVNVQRENGGWLEQTPTASPLEDPFYTSQAVISLYRNSATAGGATIRKAFQWLKTMMVEPAGDFLDPYDQSSPTSLALLALDSINSNGDYNESIGEALARVVAAQKSNGTWNPDLSKSHSKDKHLTPAASLLRALGETDLDAYGKSAAITKAVNYLITNQNDDDGGWPAYSYPPSGLRSEINPTIGSLLALLSENVVLQREVVGDGIAWLLQQKVGPGDWGAISHTANIAKILDTFGEYPAEFDEAVAWLMQAQHVDGSWFGVSATACALLALIQTGNQGPETARAVQWLLAVQNDDGGWPILAGMANSSTNPTAYAVRALTLAARPTGPELAISFDKPAYQPGDTVTITVESEGDTFQVQQVTGIVVEYEGESYSIAFAKVGNMFIGTHVLSSVHPAGTDIVSVEAHTLEGVPGYGAGTFVVENRADVFADLAITGADIMFSPELPDEGRTVLIAARVHNIGQVASAPAAVRFLNGTAPIGADQALGILEPGESDIVFMQWDTHGQLGRNYIHVVADPLNEVTDVNRSNNSAMRAIDVAPRSLPDLEVRDTDIGFADASPVEGAEVEVNATVRNLGADVDGVVVHFYDSEAAAENLIAERVIHEIVPFGGSASVSAVFDTAGRAGECRIIVQADPYAMIREQNESNNTGTALLDVLSGGLALEVSLDRESYAYDEDVLASAAVTNSFDHERVVTIDLAVYDPSGAPFEQVARDAVIVAPPGATVVVDDFVWNTAHAPAGQWRVVATLFEDDQRRAADAVFFMILADQTISARVTTERQLYYDHAQVRISSVLQSFSPNYAFTGLSAFVELRNPEGDVLYTDEHIIGVLPPLMGSTWDLFWNTALHAPGLYALTLSVFQDGTPIASDSAHFTIARSEEGGRGLTGHVSAAPDRVYPGQDVELTWGLSAVGNVAPDEAQVSISAVNSATQDVALVLEDSCYFEEGTCSGTRVLDSSALACGDYALVLAASTDAAAQNLAFAPLSVVNRCPVAVAGYDVLAHVGDSVQLDGSGSYDPDGHSLTYSWSPGSLPPESLAELAGADQYNPSLVIDRHGTYELRLSVSDGMCQSQSDSVLVTTENRPPIAVVGESLLADVGQIVQLDASQSHDPDNDPIVQYEWTLVSRPSGSAASLSDRFSSAPVFTADMPGAYRLQLMVRDFEYASDPVELEVTTRNRRPVADCGPAREVDVGDTVQLESSASYDPDFDPISCRWALLSVPEGSLCALDNATAPAPTFVADMPGAYIVQLIVSDAELDSIPVTCTITTRNRLPFAVAAADPEQAPVATLVHLSAALSSDPDGDALTYSWAFVTVPQGSSAVIDGGNAVAASFVPDLPGSYLVMLTVNDGSGIDTALVMVEATQDNPPECADDLGAAQEYSIFALGGAVSRNATVAGRIAAGGDVDFENVVMATHVPRGAPEEPVLVSGGDIDYTRGVVHAGSIIAAGSVEGVSDKVRRSLPAGASVTGYAQLPFDFDAEAGNLRQLSARLAGFPSTGLAEYFAAILTLRGDGVSDFQFFTVDAQQARSARSLHLRDIPRQATVIVNVRGEQAVFSHIGMAVPGWMRGRVLFNFSEAISLEFTAVALKGSVLAPMAELTNSGGIIFGTVAVNSWQGSMNVGHEPFIGTLPECEP